MTRVGLGRLEEEDSDSSSVLDELGTSRKKPAGIPKVFELPQGTVITTPFDGGKDVVLKHTVYVDTEKKIVVFDPKEAKRIAGRQPIVNIAKIADVVGIEGLALQPTA